MVGVVASVVINWVLWPFIARHELRQAMSAMMFFLSIIYRSNKTSVPLFSFVYFNLVLWLTEYALFYFVLPTPHRHYCRVYLL